MTVSEFAYLIDKVRAAEFASEPFKHIEIENFFSPEHFQAIVTAPEILIGRADSDKELCDSLFESGWEPIEFPGCTTSIPDYLAWRDGRAGFKNVDTCEGFGVVFRLARARTKLIESLKEFLASPEFLQNLASKFDIEMSTVSGDVGIQKYLDGYEISPHPDIRTKALTFMVNINPHSDSEQRDHHTHYLRFNDQWRYVEEFWRHNPQFERAWVPWPWCHTVKQQTANNSIVIFSPDCNTMHSVRAKYDHLDGQRTQLYGNLWYGAGKHSSLPQIPWQGLQLDERRGSEAVMVGQPIISRMVNVAKRKLSR